MLGVFIDFSAIIVGGFIGVYLKKQISKEIITSLFQILGIVTIVTSIVGIISNMIEINENTLQCNKLIIVISSILIGAVIGEIANLENLIYSLSYKLEEKYGASNFKQGFISSFIFFGVGALQIIGPINSILQNDNSILITKSIIDFPFAIAFATVLGLGVMFSAFPVAVSQIFIGLLSLGLQLFITDELIMQLSSIGYVILFCAGLNMAFDKLIEIKTVNLVPSIFVVFITNIIIAAFGL